MSIAAEKAELARVALEGSIKKWERIVDGTGDDRASDNCPLCAVFIEDACKGCPVRERTGLPQCGGTPWTQWISVTMGMNLPRQVTNSVQRTAALAELEFLRSLRS